MITPTLGRVELLYPSEYIKAADLFGKEFVQLHIAKIVRKELQRTDGKKSMETVVSFKESERKPPGQRKSWVMCKTNSYRLSWHLGGDLDAWIGMPFKLGVQQVSAWGATVPALRVLKDPQLQTQAGVEFVKTVIPRAWDRWWSL